jgi:hypothetical protein
MLALKKARHLLIITPSFDAAALHVMRIFTYRPCTHWAERKRRIISLTRCWKGIVKAFFKTVEVPTPSGGHGMELRAVSKDYSPTLTVL